ncbi:MAG TPA: TraR/DksA C4-type zinc finger protein [Deferrisomatales bacterium]|nr:TraR/DksA C4-type zinc finger protein [Deferrisomatales bacterium]
MPDLTAAQTAELVKDLLVLRETLQAQCATAREEARPVDLALPIGRLSRMDAMQQQGMAVANRRSLELRLQQIAAALAAHGEGAYGYCRSCDEPVGYPRLKARPETPLCLECQGAKERQ